MSSSESNDEKIVEKLKASLQSIIKKTGADSEYVKDLVAKINNLQEQIKILSTTDRARFMHEMKDSFTSTIQRLEQKITQHENFQHVYRYSIVAAMLVIIVLIFALFGYKLYKSLKEKELKRQGKAKGKQAKKSKKSN